MAKKRNPRRMTPRKKGVAGTGIKSDTALLVGGGLLGLYLITRPGKGGGDGQGPVGPSGPGGEPGKSILQGWTDAVTKSIAGTVIGVAEVPGAIVFGLPKKIVETSEEQTSQQIFGGEKRTGVSAFMATEPAGSVFTQPITYSQFMEQQPIVFRAAATTGNILTGQVASQYGAYVAEETKKGQAIAGRPPGEFAERFAAYPKTVADRPGAGWMGQSLIGLGQALTVPFGGGGAAGWGAAVSNWFTPVTKKEAAVTDITPKATTPSFTLPFQKEATIAYGSNVIAQAYGPREVYGPPSPITKKEAAIKIPAGYSTEKLPGMDVYRMIDGQKVWR